MSRERELVKNTAIISLGTFLPKVASFITLPILTAALTKKEYGTYDLINTLISFFLPVVTLQIQSAAFRFLIEYRKEEEKVKSVITNIVLFIVPISLLSLSILFLSLFYLSIEIRLLICAYFFLDILVSTLRQIIRGLANNMLYSISALVETLTNTVLVICIIKIADKGLVGLLLILVISVCTSLCVLLAKGNILKKIDFHCSSLKMIKEMLSYSWPMIPSVMSSTVLMLSDRLIITFFLGIEINAVYSVANKIPNLLFLVQNTFAYAWQENASLVSKDDNVDLYYTSVFDSVIRIATGMTVLLIAASPILFTILIWGTYAQAYVQIPILFGAMMFSIVATFSGGIYVSLKKTKSIALTTTLTAVFNLLFNLSLINYIGIYAASISTLLSYLFLCVFRMYNIKKFIKINYNLNRIGSYMIVLILVCVLYWMQSSFFNIINVIISIIFASLVNKKFIKELYKIAKSKICGKHIIEKL